MYTLTGTSTSCHKCPGAHIPKHACRKFPALRPRGKHTQIRSSCTHTVQALTHTLVSPLRQIFTISLHTCRTQQYSHRHNIYTYTSTRTAMNISVYTLMHTAAPTPKYIQLLHIHLCPAVQAQAYLYTQTHTGLSYRYIVHKTILTYVHMGHVYPGTHPLYIQHTKHAYTSVCEYIHTSVHIQASAYRLHTSRLPHTYTQIC